MAPLRRPCANCGKLCVGRRCRACACHWKKEHPESQGCSPETARAIVALLRADPGTASVHGDRGKTREVAL